MFLNVLPTLNILTDLKEPTDRKRALTILMRRKTECNTEAHISIEISGELVHYISRLMTKPTICICENKDADQLRGNREADQRLCFRYTDSTVPVLLKSEISSF